MMIALHQKKLSLFNRLSAMTILLCFWGTTIVPPSFAQEIFLPAPGTIVGLSPAYAPPELLGLRTHKENPFRFDFILDTGEARLSSAEVNTESSQLIKYFLTALTIPEKDLWVNLSPYEKNRIIPDELSQTAMGKELLVQDYFLKQLSSSLSYPESELGKQFWARALKEAERKLGTADIPVDTFNRVWIVPDKAVVYENNDVVFIGESHLKVMLEEDYVAMSNQKDIAESRAPARDQTMVKIDVISNEVSPYGTNPEGVKQSFANGIAASPAAPRNDTNSIGSQIMRKIIIPELEKEVNSGKNFAKLRQMYSTMILAAWYKQTLKDGLLGKAYVNGKKMAGIDIPNENIKEKVYAQYLEAFKKGAYSLIKEEVDLLSGETIPRKYFSGGVVGEVSKILERRASSSVVWTERVRRGLAAGLAVLISVVLIRPPQTAVGTPFVEPGYEIQTADSQPLKFASREEQQLAERRERWLSLANENYTAVFERAQEFIDEPFAYEVLEKAAFVAPPGPFMTSARTALKYFDNYASHPRAWELLESISRLYGPELYDQLDFLMNRPYIGKVLDVLVKHNASDLFYLLQSPADVRSPMLPRAGNDQILGILKRSDNPATKEILEIIASNYDGNTKLMLLALLDSLVRGELSLESAAALVKDEAKFIDELIEISGRKDYLSRQSVRLAFSKLSYDFYEGNKKLDLEQLKKTLEKTPVKNVLYLMAYGGRNTQKIYDSLNFHLFDWIIPQLRSNPQVVKDFIERERIGGQGLRSFFRLAAEFDRLEEILSAIDSATADVLLKNFILGRKQDSEMTFGNQSRISNLLVTMILASDLLQRPDISSQNVMFYQKTLQQTKKDISALNLWYFLKISSRYRSKGFVSELIEAKILEAAQVEPGLEFFIHSSKDSLFLSRPVGPKAIIEAARNNPVAAMHWVAFIRFTDDLEIKKIAQSIIDSDPAMKILADIATQQYDVNSKNVTWEFRERVAVLLDRLVTGEMTMAQARDLAGDPFILARELFRIQSKPGHLGRFALEKYLSDFYLRMVRQINDLHEQPEAIRFKSLEQATAQDLYILMVEGEQEIFTSSFNGIFNRLLDKMKKSGISGQQLLQQTDYKRFRIFVRLLTGFGRLNDFLATMDEAGQKELINKFTRGIGQEKNSLEQAVVVAETFGMIKDKALLVILQKIVHEEYNRASAAQHAQGTTLYGLLSGFFGQDALVDKDWFKEMAIKYPISKVSGVSSDKLFNARGENIQQHFFYYDEGGDGQASFEHFISTYKSDSKWKITYEENYVRIVGSESGKKVIMLANKPIKDKEDKGVEDIAAYLKAQGLQRQMVVHRGHSYHAYKTIDQIQPTDIIVSLGSCGGFNNVAKVLDRAPQAHILSTKGTGTMYVNDPLLKLLNNAMLKGDIDWASFWAAAEKSISSTHFNLYVAPHKNLGALFIKAYNTMVKPDTEQAQKVSLNDLDDLGNQDVARNVLNAAVGSYVRLANTATTSGEDVRSEFFELYTLMTTWFGRFDLIAFFNDYGQEKELPAVSQVVSVIAQHGMLKEYNSAVDGSLAAGLAQGLESATAASSSLVNNPGGIDLDAGKLDLEIKRKASSALTPEFSGFENFVPIDGLAPMIINVTPITNLPLMLGLSGDDARKDS